MNQPIELSLEQEFSLRTFADQVKQMSREQAQGLPIKKIINRCVGRGAGGREQGEKKSII